MKYQAVIFDMDGVLVDSMMHWIAADREFFKPFNIELTDEMVRYFTGRSETENISWLKNEFGLAESLEELRVMRRQTTQKIYSHHSVVLPGVDELIAALKQRGLILSIASGARHDDIKQVVERFNWHEHFDCLISSDHVDHVGKPNPLIYRRTAEVLGVAPARCVVIEDAENGIVAAKAAGMSCIAVPDKRWSVGDFSGADLIVDSLEDARILDFVFAS